MHIFSTAHSNELEQHASFQTRLTSAAFSREHSAKEMDWFRLMWLFEWFRRLKAGDVPSTPTEFHCRDVSLRVRQRWAGRTAGVVSITSCSVCSLTHPRTMSCEWFWQQVGCELTNLFMFVHVYFWLWSFLKMTSAEVLCHTTSTFVESGGSGIFLIWNDRTSIYNLQ